KRSASRCPRRCSPAPTRSSNDASLCCGAWVRYWHFRDVPPTSAVTAVLGTKADVNALLDKSTARHGSRFQAHFHLQQHQGSTERSTIRDLLFSLPPAGARKPIWGR